MSETFDPSVTDEQSAESVTQQRAAESDDPNLLRQKLELVQQDSRRKGEVNKKMLQQVEDLQRQIADLQANSKKQKEAKLQEQGEYLPLWKEATATNSQLQEQIAQLQREKEEMAAAHQQATIQARAVSAFQQAGVQQSEHMYALLKDKLRLKDGSVVALDGGVETDLGSFLNNLKAPDSQFAYMFAGSGARGMGSSGSTPVSTGGGDNPYVSKNFTKIVELEATNPELAARLKAQAS